MREFGARKINAALVSSALSRHSHFHAALALQRLKPQGQKLLDHFDIRPRVTRKAARPECAAPREGHRKKELIREVFADRFGMAEIMPYLIDDIVGHLFGWHSFFAETGENFGQSFMADFRREDEPRAAT